MTEIKDTPLDQFERINAVDARGVFLCMKYQIRQMEAQSVPDRPRASRGVIINIASRASLEGVAKFGSYCAVGLAMLSEGEIVERG